jgi:hypothetical protein
MASTGLINKSYVSALDPLLDTREINRLITDIYNEDELTDILTYGDRKMPSVQPFYSTYIDESIFKLGDTTGGSITNNNTTTITVVFTAATSGYTRPNDEIIFVNGNVGLVSTVTNSSGIDTVVIKSVSGANLSCTAGDQLSIFSMAVGENSSSPTNLRYGVTRYFNKLQIFRETSKITDVQSAATVEVNFQGQNKWFYKDQWEKTVKLKGNINAAFWGGDMSNTSFSDTNPFLLDPVNGPSQTSTSVGGGGGAIQTTRGVNKYIALYGQTLVNGTLGTYQQTNLDNIQDVLISVRSPKQYLVAGSSKALRATDRFFKALGSSGLNSVRLIVDGHEVDMNVNKVMYGGFEFNYMLMPILDHPTLFSQTDISRSLYYIPYNNKVKVEGGGSDAAIRVRYFPKQSLYGNDLINEIHGGGYSPVNPNGSGANVQVDWVTTQGLECLGVQQFAKQVVV